jgi:coproporphyrinogen III oxidase-like Fe-S oxidoreductase
LLDFEQRFGSEMTAIYGNEIEELIGLGLLEKINQTSDVSKTSEVLRITKQGRLLGNQVFLRFV